MQRFEYRHLTLEVSELATPTFNERLAALGNEGWQLTATVTHEKHGYSHDVHLIFMRPAGE